jgi:hypothetical protein
MLWVVGIILLFLFGKVRILLVQSQEKDFEVKCMVTPNINWMCFPSTALHVFTNKKMYLTTYQYLKVTRP